MNEKQIKPFEVEAGIAGYKRAVVLKAKDRSVVSDTGWTKNLITDSGLDAFCRDSSLFTNYCRVGTGSTAPANTDTALVSEVAVTNTSISGGNSSGANETEGYTYYQWGKEFPEGAISGQSLSEIGFSNSASGALGSRSLLLDGAGNPTTVTVQSDEILQVYYELRVYWPATDVNTSIVDTTTGINHSVVIRPCMVLDSGFWGASAGLGWASSQVTNTYRGTLGAITESPSTPSGTTSSTTTLNSYVSGDYWRERIYTFSLSQGNATSPGVTAIRFVFGKTAWQLSFDPAIQKTDTKKWDVGVKVAVNRATI